MTYANLRDSVQGVMDYTFYPYRPTVNGLHFIITDKSLGALGSGALTYLKDAPTDTAR